LALRLGWDWADADVEIELRAGKSIQAIFADDGEPAFRELETVVVAELAQRERTVVALGGGAVLREENRSAIRSGQVVWLQADVETILARIAADPTTADRRPNLTAVGGAAEVSRLLSERTPVYRQCADLTVDTEGKTLVQVTDEIINGLGLTSFEMA
jgi:shikimate kinase